MQNKKTSARRSLPASCFRQRALPLIAALVVRPFDAAILATMSEAQEPQAEEEALLTLRLALDAARADAETVAKQQEERWSLEGRLYELQVRLALPGQLREALTDHSTAPSPVVRGSIVRPPRRPARAGG